MSPRRASVLLGLLLVLAACGPSTPSVAGACPAAAPTADAARQILADASTASVETNKGTFVISLDPSSAPIATASFVALARCGFYDGISFHRVLAGFVIQAGDPQTKTNRQDFKALGSGGPGYQYAVELPAATQPYAPYTVAMANGMRYPPGTCTPTEGQDTNGSQFFVTLDDLRQQLCPLYSVLGHVTSGTDVVDTISRLPINDPTRGVPLDPAIIVALRIGGAAASPTP